VMADEVVAHAFSHGFHPQHVQRLAAYWAEALGGSTAYSDSCGDETTVVKMHSGNGEHDEMDRRAIACFDQALADVGLASDGTLRQCCTTTSPGRPRQRCPATTSPPMMCRTASVSHTGRGTDSKSKTLPPQLRTFISPLLWRSAPLNNQAKRMQPLSRTVWYFFRAVKTKCEDWFFVGPTSCAAQKTGTNGCRLCGNYHLVNISRQPSL
jgi:hypothetical protein